MWTSRSTSSQATAGVASDAANRRYERDVHAAAVTTMPMRPAIVNRSAIPRSGPVPNQSPMARAPAPSVMVGMNTDSVRGPRRMAVTGAAEFSTSWAKPNTRPCRS